MKLKLTRIVPLPAFRPNRQERDIDLTFHVGLRDTYLCSLLIAKLVTMMHLHCESADDLLSLAICSLTHSTPRPAPCTARCRGRPR